MKLAPTRRRARIQFLSSAILLVGIFLILRVREEPYPGIPTFNQVREGMTWMEVEQVVGGPPGYYADAYRRIGTAAKTGEARLPCATRHAAWYCDDGYMKIQFGDDKVSILVVIDLSGHRMSSLGKLRKWLGL